MAGFFSTTANLAAANTAYTAYSILYAANNQVPTKCCELQIQSVQANVYVGDANMNNSNTAGQNLGASGSTTFRTERNFIPLKEINVMCDAVGARLVRLTAVVS